MLPLMYLLSSPTEIALTIGKNAQTLRLAKNLSRKTLAQKSGVPVSTIKRFELQGAVSLQAMILIAAALDDLPALSSLFNSDTPRSLYELKNAQRKRGTQ